MNEREGPSLVLYQKAVSRFLASKEEGLRKHEWAKVGRHYYGRNTKEWLRHQYRTGKVRELLQTQQNQDRCLLKGLGDSGDEAVIVRKRIRKTRNLLRRFNKL